MKVDAVKAVPCPGRDLDQDEAQASPHGNTVCAQGSGGLAGAFRLFYRRFRSLEPDAAVSAVAEWFGH